MIQRKWNFGVLLTLLSGILIFYACKDSGTDSNAASETAPSAPSISTISPTEGPPGITVTIEGSGFGATASDNRVTFNGILAEVTSASNSSLDATVPGGAQTGAVEVTVAGQTAVGPNFTVEEQMPGITAVKPDSGTVGTPVAVTGMNFDPTPSNNIVTFNGGVISAVDQASDTLLTTTVPEGAESGPIQVEVDGTRTVSPAFHVITTGVLEVAVVTSGPVQADYDPDGYHLKIDGLDRDSIGINETVTIPELNEGTHQAALDGLALNCTVETENPQQVSIVAGDTASVSFDITCDEKKQQFLFISDRSTYDQIYTMDVECCDSPVSLTNDRLAKEDMVISRDHTLVAYEATKINGVSSIYVVKTDGSSSPKQIATVGVDPAFSPDGSKVAFGVSDGITVVNADGSGSPVSLTNSSLDGTNPDWSPDGSQIVFEGGTSIFVVKSDGSTAPDSLTQGEDPEWSPVDNQIVYWEFDSDDQEIYLIDSNGSSPPVKLTDNFLITEENPTWSPDGSQIAFERFNSTNNAFNIYKLELDFGTTENMTHDSQDNRNPVWSPDGSNIIYERIEGTNVDIYQTVGPQLTTDGKNPVWGGTQ